MNIQHATPQQTTGRASWASPTLTHFGSLHALTASGSGLLTEYVICEQDPVTNLPIPGTCFPLADQGKRS